MRVVIATAGLPGLRPQLLLAAVDLAWLGPCLWLGAALVGVEPTRTAAPFVLLHPAGLALGLLLGTSLARPVRLGTRLLGSALLLALATWAALHAPLSLFAAGWLGAVLDALARTPYGLSAEALLIPAGVLMLWRGGWLAGTVPSHRTTGTSFQAGIVALALVGAIGGERHAVYSLAAAMVFLAVGLLALAVARSDEAGARRDSVARLWALGFTGLLLTAALAASLWGGAVAQTLADLATRALEAFLSALAALAAWLSSMVGPREAGGLPPELVAEAQPAERSPLAELLVVPEPVRRVGGFMVLLGMVAPILIAAVRYLGELWRRLADPLFMVGIRVTRLETEHDGGLMGLLRRFLYRWGRLLWRAAGGRALDGDPRAWPVRLAYRDLLRRAAGRGAPRPDSLTPAEYVDELARAYPGETENILAITRAYERARYGPASDGHEAAAVRARVRRVIRRRWFGR